MKNKAQYKNPANCDAYKFVFLYTGKDQDGKTHQEKFTLFDIEARRLQVWITENNILTESITRSLIK